VRRPRTLFPWPRRARHVPPFQRTRADPRPFWFLLTSCALRSIGGDCGGVRPARRAIAQGRSRTHGHRSGVQTRLGTPECVPEQNLIRTRRRRRVRLVRRPRSSRAFALIPCIAPREASDRAVHRVATAASSPAPPRSPATEERELEHLVRRALQQVLLLEKHPRLGVLVVLQVVSSDGAMEACAMNAASAAILDAAVPSRGVLCAATSATVPTAKSTAGSTAGAATAVAADPTADETETAENVTTASFCFRGGRCLEDTSERETSREKEEENVYGVPPSALPDAEPEVLHTTSRGAYEDDESYFEAIVATRDAAVNVFLVLRDSFREGTSAREGRNAFAEPEAIARRAEEAKASAPCARGSAYPGSGGFRQKFGVAREEKNDAGNEAVAELMVEVHEEASVDRDARRAR